MALLRASQCLIFLPGIFLSVRWQMFSVGIRNSTGKMQEGIGKGVEFEEESGAS